MTRDLWLLNTRSHATDTNPLSANPRQRSNKLKKFVSRGWRIVECVWFLCGLALKKLNQYIYCKFKKENKNTNKKKCSTKNPGKCWKLSFSLMLCRGQHSTNNHALTQTPLDLYQHWVRERRTWIPQVLH